MANEAVFLGGELGRVDGVGGDTFFLNEFFDLYWVSVESPERPTTDCSSMKGCENVGKTNNVQCFPSSVTDERLGNDGYALARWLSRLATCGGKRRSLGHG